MNVENEQSKIAYEVSNKLPADDTKTKDKLNWKME